MKINRMMLKAMKVRLTVINKFDHKKKDLPSGNKIKKDIKPYPEATYEQSYDLLYADKPNGMTLIDIHGGAYIYSHRTNNYPFAKVFLDKGFNVALMDYRLNKGHLDIHDQVRDIAKSIKHLFEHGEELGIDKNRIAIMGDSAGGHFALLLAEMTLHSEIVSDLGIDFSNVHFLSCAVNSPLYNLTSSGEARALAESAMIYMFGKRYLDLEYQYIVDPKKHFDGFTLPLFLSTCKNDFIRAQSVELYEDAKKKGIDLEYLDIDDDNKEVDHIHNVTKVHLDPSIKVNDAMEEFFLRHDKK